MFSLCKANWCDPMSKTDWLIQLDQGNIIFESLLIIFLWNNYSLWVPDLRWIRTIASFTII